MVKMGNVWDRTMAVLNGRGGMLAGMAILTLFVPPVIAAAHSAYATPGGGTAAIGALLALVTAIAALWGQLFIIAASSDQDVDRATALRQARSRLLPALLLAVVLAVIMTVVILPAFVLLSFAGFDFVAMSRGGNPGSIAPGMALIASLYVVVILIGLLFVGARLLPLYAVLLHECLGLGAISRCWRLTRRHTWRLVGVVLLFLVVLLIATTAAQLVGGLLVRLILGGDALATVAFIAAIIAQAVSTALTLIAIVFSAQLYVALVARERMLHERATQARAAA